MSDNDITLTGEAAEAQKSFEEGIWYAIADGEMLGLTKGEMAMILDEVADELEIEHLK